MQRKTKNLKINKNSSTTHLFPHVNISSSSLLTIAFLLHLNPLLRFHSKYLGG